MTDDLSVNVRGVKELQAFFKTLPRGTIRVGIAAASEYILGDESHGLRHYQPYKYIKRARAYGQTFQSDKQRRYVMAKIRSGEITPGKENRTGLTAAGWYTRGTNNGYTMALRNETTGAYFSQNDTGQARLNKLAGWRKVSAVIATNLKGAMQAAERAVEKWIRNNEPK